MQPGEIATLQIENDVTKDPPPHTHIVIPHQRMLSPDTFRQFFFSFPFTMHFGHIHPSDYLLLDIQHQVFLFPVKIHSKMVLPHPAAIQG